MGLNMMNHFYIFLNIFGDMNLKKKFVQDWLKLDNIYTFIESPLYFFAKM